MSDSGSGTVMSIIPFWLVLAAIGFAVVVGLLSGIVPASRAVRISALEPSGTIKSNAPSRKGGRVFV